MIDIVNQQSNILAHVHIDIIGPGQKLLCLINQIRGENAADQSIFIIVIEFFQTAGKQTEGGADKDLVRLPAFQLLRSTPH